MQRRLLYVTTLLAATLTLGVTIITFLGPLEFYSRWIQIALAALVGSMLTAYVAQFVRTLNQNPTPLQVALVGGPRSGKTVFLTVLFNELQVSSTDHISFQPYGRETIEAVGANMNLLTAGKWLGPTSKESVFFFRANAIVGRGLFSRKFTVEIGDYAGERIDEFDSSSEQWLHRTEYFKYVVGCDVILLAVDADKLANMDGAGIARMENALVAAFQVLIDEKGVAADRRLRAPVALLVLKADLLAHSNDDVVQQRLARLIRLCERRCRAFRLFRVTAVGRLDDSGKPPPGLQPRGVIEPMLWALDHIGK